MNQPLPPDSSERDSLAYKLVNAYICVLTENKDSLVVSYQRDLGLRQVTIPLDDLTLLHPGLPQAVIALHKMAAPGERQFLLRLNVTVNHYLGNFVDLSSDKTTSDTYPYLTNIEQVCTSEHPGLFSVVARRYKLSDVNFEGLHLVDVDGSHYQLIEVALLENAWPGCAKSVPLMESLDYTPQEVIETLLRDASSRRGVTLDASIKFD